MKPQASITPSPLPHATAAATATPPAGPALPSTYNYIGAFLTFRCPFHCSFCINRFHGNTVMQYKEIPGRDWLAFFDKLETRNVPITLQGGEPGLHPDFIELVSELSRTRPVDILTNLAFNLKAFIERVDPARLNREAPYAPIRISYHPRQFTLQMVVRRALTLRNAGFRVGIYGVTHPDQLEDIEEARKICADLGLDFRTKPFLGRHEGRLYGDYAFPGACDGQPSHVCECAPSELLLAPDGSIHRCHHHLYEKLPPLARISGPRIALSDKFKPCSYYGACNPCDIKVKNNRFQQFGHVSARIRNLRPLPSPAAANRAHA